VLVVSSDGRYGGGGADGSAEARGFAISSYGGGAIWVGDVVKPWLL
jgi:hypothetical protein